ncbi:hypothetical protein [Bifidobacterium aquikefiricola]|uniref:Uncharacterized protein n=1 Tax=Bifidobacterium aquikefiricola TaxID=3059038 RepID=A0AB39U7B1_9BIFI
MQRTERPVETRYPSRFGEEVLVTPAAQAGQAQFSTLVSARIASFAAISEYTGEKLLK